MSGDARMQQNGDESVGSVNMPTHTTPTEQVTPIFGSPPYRGLMRQRSFSPMQRFAPYGAPSMAGASSPGAPTAQSGAIHGVTQPYVPTLAEYQQRLFEQVSTATVPLTVQVA